MDWKDVGSWLEGNAGTGAALVGSLITGNVPGAVAAGIALVRSTTGANSADDAMAQLQANPDVLVKLRELAQQNEGEIRAHLQAMEQMRLADVADARKRDTAFVTAGRHNMRADLMVILDVVGLIACLAVLAVYRKEMPAEVATLLSTIAGGFLLCLRDAHNFEFGSSRGSRDKDERFAKEASK